MVTPLFSARGWGGKKKKGRVSISQYGQKGTKQGYITVGYCLGVLEKENPIRGR